ncbi:hypothetical protein O3M35_007079 [Rhynocoris fuscipes]|uniref:Uncharacterized protein n=1 Tax=Rhynocoris fuscipes TaxID=488301 RepID=A0AAW1D9P1_9HEMI
MRLSTIWTLCSLMSCIARPIEDKLMTLLKGMNDEQLTALEERLANLLQKDDDQMQGDMPFPVNESDSIRAAKER